MAVDAQRTVIIAAPLAQVLAVVRDVADQPAWWPGLRGTEVLEQDEIGRVFRARIASDVKVVTDTFEVAYTHTDTAVTWELVGTSLAQRRQRGRWTLADHPDGTEATLELEIEASLPLPKLVQRRIVRDTVVGAVAGLKARCEA
jgi:ribosome-associated toxin RatA of RatAB toxin-antitoxin module